MDRSVGKLPGYVVFYAVTAGRCVTADVCSDDDAANRSSGRGTFRGRPGTDIVSRRCGKPDIIDDDADG